MAKSYRVLVALRYPDGPSNLAKRKARDPDVVWKIAPEGSVQTDIPSESIPWLLDQERIEEVKPGPLKVKEVSDG